MEVWKIVYQRWSPRGHNLKSLALKVKSLALASNPASPRKCSVLGSRTELFFDFLKMGQGYMSSIVSPWSTPKNLRKKIFGRLSFVENLRIFGQRPFLFFFGEHFGVVFLVLGFKHFCPWPREGLSTEGVSLTLASDFFCVLSLGLEPSVLDSTSVDYHSILEIFHSVPFWYLPYSMPKFPSHSIFHFIPCPAL